MADHTRLFATRDDEYEIIGRIRPERDQSFIVPAEVECAQRHGHVLALVGPTLVSHRVDDHGRIQKRAKRRLPG
jgi:hypothetical protein